MDRLQKKCFIGSAGFHLLLVAILLTGPAFLSSKSKSDDLPPLNFVPSILIDGAEQGGGNPNVRPPPAAPMSTPPVQAAPPPQVVTPPPAPTPTPTPVLPPEKPQPRVKEPDAPKEVIKNQRPDPNAVEPTRKSRLPDVSTAMVTRKPNSNTKPNITSSTAAADEARAEERRWSEQRKQLANRIGSAASSITSGASSATAIQDYGPGSGGPAYANYKAYVQSVYLESWAPPDDAASDTAVAYALITIASDGTIVSHRIIQRSGDRRVDDSVEMTLERVRTIGRAFPEGTKDKERTYKLRFDLKIKRGMA